MAVGTGPHRDPVAEPELAGDVPIRDIADPAQVLLTPALRMKAELVALRHGDRWPGQRFHFYPPLRRDQRLDDGTAPVTVTDRAPAGLDFLQRSLPAKHLDDPLARFWDRQSMKLGGLRDIRPAVPRQDAQHRKGMPLPHPLHRG